MAETEGPSIKDAEQKVLETGKKVGADATTLQVCGDDKEIAGERAERLAQMERMGLFKRAA